MYIVKIGMTSTVLPPIRVTWKVPSSAGSIGIFSPTSSRRQRRDSTSLGVPYAEVADPGALLVGQPLDGVGRAALEVLGLVSLDHLFGPQPLQGVGTDQEREVREAAHEVGVIPSLVDQDLGEAEEDRRVGQAGAHADPVVRLCARTVVLRGDVHELAAALHHLVQPVRLGHLVLDQVLAHLDDQLGEPQVVHVHVGGLQPVDVRVSRHWSPRQVYSFQSRAPRACSGGTPRTWWSSRPIRLAMR